jgi:lysophospholipase L1-like esterase
MTKKPSRRTFLKTSILTSLASFLPFGSIMGETKIRSKALRTELKSDEKNLVFLFQGDSITDGNRGRNADPNHIMGHGYAFSVTSRVGADFPNDGFTFYNRGISGNKVSDLQKRWQTDTLDLKPNVLSILVGINDVDEFIKNPGSAPGPEEFEMTYRDILNQSENANPSTLFVLGLPFFYPIGSRKVNGEKWNDGTIKRATVVRKLANEFNAVLVDYPTLFDKAMKNTSPDYWIWDGIHPTVFGHELMTREWIKQVSKRLKFLKIYKY